MDAKTVVPPAATAVDPALPQSGFAAVWPRSVQLAAGFLLALVLLFLGRSLLSRGNARPADPLDQSIDLNQAGRAELLLLPGIGETLSERILNHRRDKGPFEKIEDLRKVHGIGPATLERLRSWVRVGPAIAPAGERKAQVLVDENAKTPAHRKASGPSSLIDPNSATLEQLQELPGIGPVLSQRIVDERAKKPFANVTDLRRVKGIGPKTLEKVRPYVMIAPAQVLASGE